MTEDLVAYPWDLVRIGSATETAVAASQTNDWEARRPARKSPGA